MLNQRNRMARDEAPDPKRYDNLRRALLTLDSAELLPELAKLPSKLSGRFIKLMYGGAPAEDSENFASPHEREVSRMDDDRNASRAHDEPEPFKGRPQPGGAMDEAVASIRRDAGRIRVDRSGALGVAFSSAGTKVDDDFLKTIGAKS
jgi:hypothetical protein